MDILPEKGRRLETGDEESRVTRVLNYAVKHVVPLVPLLAILVGIWSTVYQAGLKTDKLKDKVDAIQGDVADIKKETSFQDRRVITLEIWRSLLDKDLSAVEAKAASTDRALKFVKGLDTLGIYYVPMAMDSGRTVGAAMKIEIRRKPR